MSGVTEKYFSTVDAARQSWDETYSLIQHFALDQVGQITSIEMSVQDFNRALLTIFELASGLSFTEGGEELISLHPQMTGAITNLSQINTTSATIAGFLRSLKDTNGTVQPPIPQGLNIQTSNRGSFDIGGQLNAIKVQVGNTLTNLVLLMPFGSQTRIDDLSSRAEVLQAKATEAVQLLAKMEADAARGEEIRSAEERVLAEISQDAASAKSNVEKTLIAQTDADNSLQQIESHLSKVKAVADQATQLENQVVAYSGKFGQFDSELTSRLESLATFQRDSEQAMLVHKSVMESATNTSKAIQESIEELITRADTMLQGATNAGLAHAFNTASEAYAAQAVKASRLFYGAIALLGVSTFPLAIYVIPGAASLSKMIGGQLGGQGAHLSMSMLGTPAMEITIAGLIGRILLLVPATWLATFASKKHSTLFNLHKDYAFKAAIAQSVDGFKRQAKEYEQEIAAATFMDLKEKPMATDEGHAKTPNFIMQFIMDKLEKRYGEFTGTKNNKDTTPKAPE